MSEYNKEDIKNLHYNNNNEIQYEYGGQIYHCSMEHLKEVLVTCWDLQQENQTLKEVIEEVREVAQELKSHYQQHPTMIPDVKLKKLLQILDKAKESK
jgi:DNA-binding transcriptional regulator PaaX